MKFRSAFKVFASVTMRAIAIYVIFAMQALGPMRLPVENVELAIMYSVMASVGWEIAEFFSKLEVL